MKRNAVTRIILYSILALTLTGLLISGIMANGFDFRVNIGSGGTVIEREATFAPSQIKSLEINWAAGSVELRAAETDHITVSEVRPESSQYKMTYKLSSDTLKLEYGSGVFSIGFGNHSIPSKNLIITVPKDWVCEELEIDGASLSIDIQDLNVKQIDLDGAACTMDFTGCVDRVDIDGASADITLNCASRISAINVDGASCDLDVTLPKNCGYLVEMDGLSCDFHSDLNGTSQNGHYSYGDQYCKINVDGISCDVTVSESTVCAHIWDEGKMSDVPGGSEQQFVHTCTLCGEINSVSPPQQQTYSILWATEFTESVLLELPDTTCAAGDIVCLKTGVIMDADLELYVNGAFICRQTEAFQSDGNNYWVFYFVMPAQDALVQLKTSDGM